MKKRVMAGILAGFLLLNNIPVGGWIAKGEEAAETELSSQMADAEESYEESTPESYEEPEPEEAQETWQEPETEETQETWQEPETEENQETWQEPETEENQETWQESETEEAQETWQESETETEIQSETEEQTDSIFLTSWLEELHFLADAEGEEEYQIFPEFTSDCYEYEVSLPENITGVYCEAIPREELLDADLNEVWVSYEGTDGTRYQEEQAILVNPVSENEDSVFLTDLVNDEIKENTLTISSQEEGEIYQIHVFQEEPQAQDEEAEFAEEYLEELHVFSSSSAPASTSEQILERQEELDEQFGGKVYVTEYSSALTSGNFFVSARLASNVPEYSQVELSAYTDKGEKVSAMIADAGENGTTRYRLSGTVFASGSKRAVYTITAGTEEHTQIYKIIVKRSLELANIACYSAADKDYAKNLMNPKYSRGQKEYEMTLPDEVDRVVLLIRPYSQQWFHLQVNGSEWQSDDPLEISVDSPLTDIVLTMSSEDGYQDPEYEGYSYVSEGKYHIILHQAVSSKADFTVIPEEAVVSLYDYKGDRILSKDSTTHHYDHLMTGTDYTYQVSCYGYISQRGSFEAQEQNSFEVNLQPIDSEPEELTGNEWWNFRNNEENNGVTNVSTPENKAETTQKWAVQLGGEWSSSSTPPLILGGYIYTAAGKYVYKLDKETGEIVTVSEELSGSMVFALNPLAYAKGMIFAQIGNGQIQALNAVTLQSMWISEPLGGQTLSPITYKDGYLYTGTWNSETAAGSYFCLSITDEDPLRKDEIKYCTWKYSHKGGFYWAGAYAASQYLVFGSDDGSAEGIYTDSSILYSVSPKTGMLIDMIPELEGDIRTTIVYENGYIYFATKGGYLYRVRMNEDGSFGQLVSVDLGGMATAAPVIYKGRIYIGVCGTGGQFNADGGHHFEVLQETESGISSAYSVTIPGYPQAAALLTTAYEQEDYNGDGKADGRVYVYFTFNSFPGGIYYIMDTPGQTDGNFYQLFEPDKAQQQYCISTICADQDGTLYYKNDSCYLMAVSSNSAYLEDMKVTADAGTVNWDKVFSSGQSEYHLSVGQETRVLHFELKIPEGRTVTVDGTANNGSFDIPVDANNKTVTITVKHGTKTHIYSVDISGSGSEAGLEELTISSSNSWTDTSGYLTMSPEFSSGQYVYQSESYQGDHNFLNIFVKPVSANAQVKAVQISGTKNAIVYKASAGSNGRHRIAVYFGEQEAEAVVQIEVVSGDKTRTEIYEVHLRRPDRFAPILTEMDAVRTGEKTAQLMFHSNEKGTLYYVIQNKGQKEPVMNYQGTGYNLMQGDNSLRLTNLDGNAKEIWVWAADENGNRFTAPQCIQLEEYEMVRITIQVTPSKAQIQVKDSMGNICSPLKNHVYELFSGNRYTVTMSCEGYHTLTKKITASRSVKEYSYELESSRSADASLKALYVSSSTKYGKGIVLLSPAFRKKVTNYTADYSGERESLYIWPEVSDENAEITVYALGGIRASTVNRKDESLSVQKDNSGRSYWNVVFANEQYEAKIRIQVKAEDGTVQNTILTLTIQDKTAPSLKKISASRISVEEASVVFQSNEKGKYYYVIVDAGAGAPSIDTDADGTDAMAGTTTISLENLTKGAKDVYVVMKDAAGNLSKILVIRIPDSKTSSGYQGHAINGTGTSGTSSGDLGGQESQKPTKDDNNGEGSPENLQKPNDNQTSHNSGKDPKKETEGSDSGKTPSQEGEHNESGNQKKDDRKDHEKESVKEKETETESSSETEETAETTAETQSESESEQEAALIDSQKDGKGMGGSDWGLRIWQSMSEAEKGIVLFAGVGILYLLFWGRAKRYSRRKIQKILL